MRPIFPRLILAVALAGLAAPALAQSQPTSQASTPAQPGEPSRTQKIEDSAGAVAKSPLKDVGVVKDEIPQVLLDARAATYALPAPLTCATIFDAVDALSQELPPDLDNPETQVKSGMSATEIGETVIHGLVPMRAWVRKLSGAEKNANEVRQALLAGSIRRGYLKGLGLQLGCKPPAAPLGVSLPTPPKAAAPAPAKPRPKKR